MEFYSVQHGVGGQTIFRNAYNNVLKRDDVRGDKTKVTDEMLINAIYDDRSRVEVKFKRVQTCGLRSKADFHKREQMHLRTIRIQLITFL